MQDSIVLAIQMAALVMLSSQLLCYQGGIGGRVQQLIVLCGLLGYVRQQADDKPNYSQSTFRPGSVIFSQNLSFLDIYGCMEACAVIYSLIGQFAVAFVKALSEVML